MQLLELVQAAVQGRAPRIPHHSLCVECKRKGVTCTMVARGDTCLGPVTHAGCGALCPSYDRGCFGCYGPMDTPNMAALDHRLADLGASARDRERAFASFYVNAKAYREHRELVTSGKVPESKS